MQLLVLLSLITFLFPKETTSTINLIKGTEPLKVETFVLDNGLTVYLNEDYTASSVFGAVIVRGGGKRDPEDATGIAHYLEHLLFKGTDKLGTIDYNKEKVFLDKIETKYEELSTTLDEAKRLEIQKKINELSLLASDFAIPNELDHLLESMGGARINAFTSDDVIVYLNKFPSNQIKKWIEVYSHRFINPVFRLFQPELEIVYEEKNRAMDNIFYRLYETYVESFFKNHPYGQQTVLGTVEHLKNPSLKKMKEYYDTYYVSNNMALVLTGNFNAKNIKPLIREKFGIWKPGEVIEPLSIDEQNFKGREFINKRFTPIKVGLLGYRTVPVNHDDTKSLYLCKQILSNESKTGLLDQLIINNAIMDAGSFNLDYVDHGGIIFYFIPKLFFQSLKKAESLLINSINELKNGNFSEELLEAVKLNVIRNHEQGIEDMERRLYALFDLFIHKKSWDETLSFPEHIKSINKSDIMETANKYFNDDYLVMYSKMGFPKKHKLEKPPYKPVKPKNSESQSEFAEKLETINEEKLDIQYIDFGQDVKYTDINPNVHFYYTDNPINNIFSLTLKYGIGNIENPRLNKTAELLNMLGTKQFSHSDFKMKLQQIGTSLTFSSNMDYFIIELKGFDEYLDESMTLLNEFISNVNPEKRKIKQLIQSAKSERKMEKKDPNEKGKALRDYIAYGENSYYLKRLTPKEIKKIGVEGFVKEFKKALSYEMDIMYVGKSAFSDVKYSIKNNLKLTKNLKKSNSPINREIVPFDEDVIYLLDDKKVLQSQIYFKIIGTENSKKDRAMSRAFNKYFGTGMGSIIFQEIREFRSLAYACGARYRVPFYNGAKGYLGGYIGCQADKTIEAVSTFNDLINNFPIKDNRFNRIQSQAIQSMNSTKPTFRNYPNQVSNWVKQGFTIDPRKEEVDFYKNMNFQDIINFYNSNIQYRPMTTTIISDLKQIDLDAIRKFGKIKKVSMKDIFN